MPLPQSHVSVSSDPTTSFPPVAYGRPGWRSCCGGLALGVGLGHCLDVGVAQRQERDEAGARVGEHRALGLLACGQGKLEGLASVSVAKDCSRCRKLTE
jgi:hypothetical protein